MIFCIQEEQLDLVMIVTLHVSPDAEKIKHVLGSCDHVGRINLGFFGSQTLGQIIDIIFLVDKVEKQNVDFRMKCK